MSPNVVRGGMPVGRLMNVPVAIGFGFFFAWQLALVSLLFPASFGLVFSPLVCQSFSCCLVSAVAVWAFVSNAGAFSARGLRWVAAASVACGSVAAVLVALGVAKGAPWSYVAAAVIGCAVAVMFYAWANVVSGLDDAQRIGTVVAGLAVSSLLTLAVGACSGVALFAAVAVLGLCSFLGFAVANARDSQQAAVQPLMFGPASSNHFKLLFLAIVLYAFVFGSVSGTTAEQASELTTRVFNVDMGKATLVIAVVLLAVLAAVRRPIRLQAVGRVLTPVLAVLFLLHILLQGSGNGWLPVLTLGFWQFVQLFVLLLLIALAQSGYASLSFVFPLGWSLVSLGFALGALFGQAVGGLFGMEMTAVQGVTVVLVIVAVLASSVLAAARYPSDSIGLSDGAIGPACDCGASPVDGGGARLAAGPGGEAALMPMPTSSTSGVLSAPPSGAVPVPPSGADPIAGACAALVRRHGLSSREAEVLDLLARGNTRVSIADKLCISENTVRVHVKNIYAKLYIHSKQQLIDMVDRLAQQKG